jgi:uncharacterized protein with WD repeat
MEFFDMDFEGEKPEEWKELTANLQLMNTADHYGVTDIDWDPTGRYVATSASIWKHTVSLPTITSLYPQLTKLDGKWLPPLRLQRRAITRRAH